MARGAERDRELLLHPAGGGPRPDELGPGRVADGRSVAAARRAGGPRHADRRRPVLHAQGGRRPRGRARRAARPPARHDEPGPRQRRATARRPFVVLRWRSPSAVREQTAPELRWMWSSERAYKDEHADAYAQVAGSLCSSMASPPRTVHPRAGPSRLADMARDSRSGCRTCVPSSLARCARQGGRKNGRGGIGRAAPGGSGRERRRGYDRAMARVIIATNSHKGGEEP